MATLFSFPVPQSDDHHDHQDTAHRQLDTAMIAAAILLQTLFFKFSGAEKSRYIFTRLGLEPWGRWGSGAVELVAAVLLLHPRTAAPGALLTLGVISGALVSHLTTLGIVVKGDGGLLFALAVVVFVSSAGVLAIRRS
jgi:putative oxidoreductase